VGKQVEKYIMGAKRTQSRERSKRDGRYQLELKEMDSLSSVVKNWGGSSVNNLEV